MTDQDVFVVFSSGPDGHHYPYGVFNSEEPAQQAREAIIRELESTATDEDALDLVHQFAGTLEEQILVEEYTLRDGFEESDVDDLFVDVEDL